MFINKIITSTTLPRLRQAVADAGRFMTERDDAEQYSAAWRDANDGYLDATWAAREAVCDELLPALIGGAWRCPTGQAWPAGTPKIQTKWALLDHPRLYRRPGATHRASWAGSALCGEPYLNPIGALNCEGLALARLFAECGCSVWHNPELSSWYPGKTSLVLIARGINADAAASLGFTKLA